jgi:ATP-dependent DNA ligase
VVVRDGSGARLYSRNGRSQNGTYPELVEALDRAAPEGLVADGEVVAFDGAHTSFARLQGRLGITADGTYRPGRRVEDWLKFKCVLEQEFVVVGYTDPAGSRTGFGAVLVGYHERRGELRYAGKVGTGFDEHALTDLRSRFDDLAVPEPPFADEVRERGAHWLRPELVAQIGFTEWTHDGRLRHPRYLGLRDDKPASEVVREDPAAR